MAIKSIYVSNIMVFQNQERKPDDGLKLDFCDGINFQQAYRMDEIQDNHIILADNQLLDEIYDL